MPPLARRPPNARPLSFGQEGLWVIEQVSQAAMRAVVIAFSIPGHISIDAVTACLREVTSRHDVLRSRIMSDARGPYAIEDEDWQIELVVETVERTGPAFADVVESSILDYSQLPFSLSTSPPCRWTIFRSPSGEMVLSLATHHIAIDLWSLRILTGELDRALSARLLTETATVTPEMPAERARQGLAFWDHTSRERAAHGEGRWERDLAFWRDTLRDVPPAMCLPGTSTPTRGIGGFNVSVDADVAQRMNDRYRRLRCTPFVGFLACVGRALTKWLDTPSVAMCTPVAGRYAHDTVSTVGLFVNRLVIPLKYAKEASTDEWIVSARRQFLKEYAHGHVPFSMVVREANPPRRFGGIGPWSQVSCQLFGAMPADSSNLRVLEPFPLPARPSLVYELSIESWIDDQGQRTVIHYRTDKLAESDVAALGHHLVGAFEEVAAPSSA